MWEIYTLMGVYAAFIALFLNTVGLGTFGLSKKLRELKVRQPKNARWYRVTDFLTKERNEETMRLIFVHLIFLRCVQTFLTFLLLSLLITGTLGIVNEVHKPLNISDLIGQSTPATSIPCEVGAFAFEFVLFIILSVWVAAYNSFILNRHQELAALGSS